MQQTNNGGEMGNDTVYYKENTRVGRVVILKGKLCNVLLIHILLGIKKCDPMLTPYNQWHFCVPVITVTMGERLIISI